ncbi:MAG: VgrG-related protein [Chloroflexota bacterium]
MPEERALIRQLFVEIEGELLPVEVMDNLYEVEVDGNLHLPDMCTLHLHDSDVELVNEGPFDLGAGIRVGVSDEQGRGDNTLFIGEIVGIEPNFGEHMAADFTVRAYDRSHRLHRGTQTKAYVRMSDSDIAKEIADAVGLRAEVDATSPVHEHMYEDGQSHMAFLRERAESIGYDFYVQDRTLYFKRAGNQSDEVVELEWGRQLQSFRPRLSLGEQVSAMQVKGWDASVKREIVGQATEGEVAPEIGESGSGSELAEENFGAASGLAVRAMVRSQDEADALAQALLDERNGAFVEAEGLCDGVPALKPGCLVEISALGDRFNGRYKVTSVTHVWDCERDYITHFRVSGRRAGTMGELLSSSSPPATQWPVTTGIVTNNSDPDNMGRVKIKFPWLDGDIESDWARVAGVGAGDGRGLYCLPEVNDEVLVTFEQGDMSRPLVVAGLWNGVDAPPADASEVVREGKVVQRMFVTRVGHKIVFSEENNAQIQIESAGGHMVLIDDDDGKIEIATAGGNTVSLDDNGRKIGITGGGEIEIQADQNLSIKASGNMNLEANGNVTIKGAIIQLNP